MIQVCWLRSGRRSQTRRRRKWHSRCSRQACEYALLGSLSAIIDKAAAHCVEKNYDEAWMLSDRLFPDMFTLARQIRQVSDSGRNIPGRLAGGELPRRHAVSLCQSTSGKIPKLCEGLHVGLPNSYFHATTAYNILRPPGVGLGKRDFLGSF
jgi:uncharacterized protein